MNDSCKIFNLIQNIWREELPVKNFSAEDDFFELGGNSLKLISVLDKMQRSYELENVSELTIVELFDTPKLGDLVALIRAKCLKK